MNRKQRKRLELWQERLERSESAFAAEAAKMSGREALYLGDAGIRRMVPHERRTVTPHIRNICSELIEAQVSSTIPQPKVTARRREDEPKAKLIEDMLRGELDRLPFEQINDMLERTVPIQGGAAFLVEWDESAGEAGELAVSALHPRQIVPQDGVYTGIEDMDYIFLKLPQTKDQIRRRYGVDVKDESETDPSAKGSEDGADDLVTQYVAYYRNGDGGIGLFSWVCDTVLADMEDYQSRRLRRCRKCGAPEMRERFRPSPAPSPEGDEAENAAAKPDAVPEEIRALDWQDLSDPDGEPQEKDVCPYCGADDWEECEEEYEELWTPIVRSDGSVVPGAVRTEEAPPPGGAEDGYVPEMRILPTRIPFYKPGIYPIILQKNVSVYGKFLGDSDIDKIASQQNTTNRIEAKIIDKLIGGGSIVTLPATATVESDAGDMRVARLTSAADKQLIGVFNIQADVSYDMAYLAEVYEEARQTIGITDSFQGRRDTTATSGKAKAFAAAQSAGRLESKRVMKEAAYAALFEAMFRFKLAYADEPRPVLSRDVHGNPGYSTFDRWDFLERDPSGGWRWNDRFIFSCDTSAPLASNREAMWQETRLNLQTGAFGDPSETETLVLFWTKMEMLHYPGAGETKASLVEKLKLEKETASGESEKQRG